MGRTVACMPTLLLLVRGFLRGLILVQEIVGLGLANFAGSAFNAYSTTGSFSRSAVNYDSGVSHRQLTGWTGYGVAVEQAMPALVGMCCAYCSIKRSL